MYHYLEISFKVMIKMNSYILRYSDRGKIM